jgi:hypothetical protein
MITLAKKAIERLNANKGLHISYEDFTNLQNGFELKLTEDTIGEFYVGFNLSELCKSRELDEPEVSSIENLRLLRIAKKIYTVYKTLLEDVIGTPINASNNQTITGTKTISSIYSGGVSYSIVDNRFDDLNDEIKTLKDTNEKLTEELNDLRALLKAKGGL